MPARDTIAYLKHADIGLQIRAYSPGAESLTDSLKMIQYTYCHLPIVAPKFLDSPRPHVIGYRPGDDDSIRTALQGALDFDRSAIRTDDIRSWDELTEELAGVALQAEPEPRP
jgi:2-beta-glucuronyltransferase